MKKEDKISLNKIEDFTKCIRNELVLENKKTQNKILGLLEYRMNKNKRHPDSIYEGYDENKKQYYGESTTSKYFKIIYKINPFDKKEFGSSDTIFNCWSYLLIFAKARKKMLLDNSNLKMEKYIYENMDKIFKGYEDFKELFEKLSDYHHSLANFMPAPIGFNGSFNHDGKGNFLKDNDFPDIYYKRAKDDFKEKYDWINEHMELLSLDFFKEYKSFFENKRANTIDLTDEKQKENFKKSIENAITSIEKRAKQLFEKCNNF